MKKKKLALPKLHLKKEQLTILSSSKMLQHQGGATLVDTNCDNQSKWCSQLCLSHTCPIVCGYPPLPPGPGDETFFSCCLNSCI